MNEELKAKIQKLRLENNFIEIIKLCDKAIEKDNKDEDAYFFKATSLIELKKYDEAIYNYNEALKFNDKNINVYLNIGIAKLNLKEYIEAIKYFSKVLELNPNYEIAYINRSSCYEKLEQYQDAIRDLDKAIELNQYNENTYFHRGVYKQFIGLYNNSIDDFSKTISIIDSYKNSYSNIDLFYSMLKSYPNLNNIKLDNNFLQTLGENAQKLIFNQINIRSKLLDTRDIYVLSFYYRALAKMFCQLNKEAFDDFNIVIQLNPTFIDAYFSRGLLKSNLAMDEEAIEDYKKVIELNPKYIDAYINIAISNSILYGYDKAMEYFDKAISINKNYSSIYLNMGMIKAFYNKYTESIEDFNTAIQISSNDPIIYFYKSKSLYNLGLYLVLDNKYFNNSYTSPYSYKLELKNGKIDTNEEINKEKFQANKRNLYWVLYYNEKENQLIYNKEKSKYASNIIDLNDLNNDDYKLELKEDDKKEDMIKYAFAKICHYTEEIKKQIEDPKNNEIYKNIKNKLYSYLFENIKYIIKHEAFFEE